MSVALRTKPVIVAPPENVGSAQLQEKRARRRCKCLVWLQATSFRGFLHAIDVEDTEAVERLEMTASQDL
jgi:hypothetical protein